MTPNRLSFLAASLFIFLDTSAPFCFFLIRLIASKLNQMLKFINNVFLKKFVLHQLIQNYHALPATYDITTGVSVTSTKTVRAAISMHHDPCSP